MGEGRGEPVYREEEEEGVAYDVFAFPNHGECFLIGRNPL